MASNVVYDRHSPYAKTQLYGNYLDLANLPVIPKLADDILFTVNSTYQHRPDLLAFDLYGDANFWWVFAMRNPNTIKDSIFDLRTGTKIYLPKKETLVGIVGA
jgi:hypothetical protein